MGVLHSFEKMKPQLCFCLKKPSLVIFTNNTGFSFSTRLNVIMENTGNIKKGFQQKSFSFENDGSVVHLVGNTSTIEKIEASFPSDIVGEGEIRAEMILTVEGNNQKKVTSLSYQVSTEGKFEPFHKPPVEKSPGTSIKNQGITCHDKYYNTVCHLVVHLVISYY